MRTPWFWYGTLTIVFFRGYQLGATEWGLIANAVKDHPNLQDLADFSWSPSVLKPSPSDIILVNENLGEAGAVVLRHLLDRSTLIISALNNLQLRY